MNFSKLELRFGSVYEEGVELPPSMFDSREAITFSKLDWSVILKDIKISDTEFLIPDFKATTREDTGKYLGTVGSVYKVRQNVEAYEFFDAVVKKHNLKYKYAGSIENDRFIFITAIRPSIIDTGSAIYGNFDGYFTIINSHDARTSLTIIFHLVHRNTNTVISIPSSVCPDRIRFPHSRKQNAGANSFVCDVEISCEKMKKYIKDASMTACKIVDIDNFLGNVIPRKKIGRLLTGDVIKKTILEIYNKTNSFSYLDLLLSASIWTTHYRDYSKCKSRITALVIDGRALDMNKKFMEAFCDMSSMIESLDSI